MKIFRRLIALLIAAIVLRAACGTRPAQASYYSLVPSSKDARECIAFDARYPYWTRQIYIATYPHHSWSREGWTAEYYGGIVSDSSPNPYAKQLIQFASWQMGGKGAPTSGIDFVHAGPYMSWKRSTWEGSSGGIKGMWPNDKFKPGQWYRFVHRVWTPATPVPHLGYAGIWMKSLETGEWFHLATFKFPAELTGFNDMGGFVEYFGGQSSEKAVVEFRNCYACVNGQWLSKPEFSAFNHKADSIALTPGDNNRSVLLETTANPIDPETKKRKVLPVATQKIALQQPEKPDFFDAPKIDAPSAEIMGRQLVVRWSVDPKSSPQLGYAIEVYDGANRVATAAGNDPEARQCDLTLPAMPQGALNVRMTLRDIFNQTSPEARIVPSPAVLIAPAAPRDLRPGLAYRYYESDEPDDWQALPEFAKLTPKRSGTTATPDITSRLRRNAYAFQFDGALRVPADGLYAFNLIAASGAKLVIGGKTVIDADGDRSIARYTGTIALKAGIHPVLVSYYYGQKWRMQADDFLQMTWAGPGFSATPVPGSAFSHSAMVNEPVLTVEARLVNGINLELAGRLDGLAGQPKRVEYYAVNEGFDYFSQQGASSADYFLAATDKPTDKPADRVSVPVWGGASKTVRARAILDDNRTVDSPAIVVRDETAPRAADDNGMRLTALEHHLYPMNNATENGTVTIVGDSMGLLTRPHKGDVTLIAHLVAITPDGAMPDGTRPEAANEWYSGIILRDNLHPRPGEPLGGAEIPFIAVMGSAAGATRHCDSTMISGAGNQPSGDVGRNAKWFKLTRQGAELAAYISKDGKEWKLIKTVSLPKMKEEIEIGFVHYSLPSATPAIHWAKFDNVSITEGAQK